MSFQVVIPLVPSLSSNHCSLYQSQTTTTNHQLKSSFSSEDCDRRLRICWIQKEIPVSSLSGTMGKPANANDDLPSEFQQLITIDEAVDKIGLGKFQHKVLFATGTCFMVSLITDPTQYYLGQSSKHISTVTLILKETS